MSTEKAAGIAKRLSHLIYLEGYADGYQQGLNHGVTTALKMIEKRGGLNAGELSQAMDDLAVEAEHRTD